MHGLLYILQDNKAIDQKYSSADHILHYVAMERIDAQGLNIKKNVRTIILI